MDPRMFLAALFLFPLLAHAQGAYPTKPIRLVVPFAAGGGVDNFARPLAQKLSEQLGQPVVIENRGGAAGVTGSGVVAAAAPDGYTLLANTDTSVYLAPLALKHASFDPMKGLTPIISAAITPMVVVVHPSLPVHTMKELVDYSKAAGQPLPYVTAGVGTLHHLTGETLALTTGAKLLHVGYRGGNPALSDLLAGNVKVGILILSVLEPHIASGKLRALAVVEGHRSKNYPDIPTIAESGIPGFSMPNTAIAIWGPAGTPPAVVNRINEEVRKAMATPQMSETMKKGGYEATPGSAADFAAEAAKSYATYKRLVAETKISVE